MQELRLWLCCLLLFNGRFVWYQLLIPTIMCMIMMRLCHLLGTMPLQLHVKPTYTAVISLLTKGDSVCCCCAVCVSLWLKAWRLRGPFLSLAFLTCLSASVCVQCVEGTFIFYHKEAGYASKMGLPEVSYFLCQVLIHSPRSFLSSQLPGVLTERSP